MTTITFDTLAYAKKMINAGFTEMQAEAQAEAIREIVEDKIATKQDLKELELRMEVKLVQIVSDAKTDIIKWVSAMLIAQAAVIATLVKLL